MSNGSYFTGRPMNYTPPEPAAPATRQEPPVNGGEQNPASAQPAPETNAYFVDRLIEQNELAPPAVAAPPPAPRAIEQPQLTGGEQHPVRKPADSYYAGRPMNYTPPEPVNGGEQNAVSAQAPGSNCHPIHQNQPVLPVPPPLTPRTIQESQVTGGEQNPVIKLDPATGSYYVGPPNEEKPPAPTTPPLPPARKEPSFLAKCCYCCPCLSSGGSLSEQ